MPYVAYAAVQFGIDIIDYTKDEWHFIKRIGDIEYKWRLTSDLEYGVAAGVYTDRFEALKCAKQIYVMLLYSVFKKGIMIKDAGCRFYCKRSYFSEQLDGDKEDYYANEGFFFSTKRNVGPFLGPGVYEVDNSISDLSDYERIIETFGGACTKADLDIDNIDEYCFAYSETARPYLHTIELVEKSLDFGLKMTLLCGLLEKLAEDNGKQNKEAEVVNVIDQLIQHVKESDLSEGQKNTLINGLNGLKEKSAREKCRLLCEKHAKTQYGEYATRTIVNSAYSIRSAYSHGNEKKDWHSSPALYMKYVVLDVLKGYMQSVEKRGTPIR